ncbi:hypothetical protein GCM10011346_01560 [Oceanobacillus neutriphilus]|uniref:Uncharacterized protein n=1 Tax=Oceanobacillus neutriphilus TaxID=531815 RepID=A0ABQ2NMD8_9BACI|nr:hypothetical protein GCM10011346_01560 [Oceanobacillus neutriphilus]
MLASIFRAKVANDSTIYFRAYKKRSTSFNADTPICILTNILIKKA